MKGRLKYMSNKKKLVSDELRQELADMQDGLSGNSSGEIDALADSLAVKLRLARKLARQRKLEEEAERQERERQREIDESIALGRLARETSFAGVCVADLLRMSEDERKEMDVVDEALEIVRIAKVSSFSSGNNVYAFLRGMVAKHRQGVQGV